MNKKAQFDGARILAVIFGIILVVGVAIPITNEILADSLILRNSTGSIIKNGSFEVGSLPAIIIDFIPIFLALAGLALAAALVALRN